MRKNLKAIKKIKMKVEGIKMKKEEMKTTPKKTKMMMRMMGRRRHGTLWLLMETSS